LFVVGLIIILLFTYTINLHAFNDTCSRFIDESYNLKSRIVPVSGTLHKIDCQTTDRIEIYISIAIIAENN